MKGCWYSILFLTCLYFLDFYRCEEVLDPTNVETEYTWEQYKIKFDKKYDKNEDEERKKIYENYLEVMRKHNKEYKQGRRSWNKGINNYSDMMHQKYYDKLKVDFSKTGSLNGSFDASKPRIQVGTAHGIYTGVEAQMIWDAYGVRDFSERPPNSLPVYHETPKIWDNEYTLYSNSHLTYPILDYANVTSIKDAPPSFDWRHYGIISKVQNQGDCGACGAFATLGAAEAMHTRMTGQSIRFSIQNLLDCLPKVGNVCQGHQLWLLARAVVTYGLMPEKDYPWDYSKYACECRRTPEGSYKMFSTYKDSRFIGDDEIIPELLRYGPLTIVLHVKPEAFWAYSGGVFDDLCRQEDTVYLHAMVLVGYTKNEYIMKNSYGPDWGRSGYIYVKRKMTKPGYGCFGHQIVSFRPGIDYKGGPPQWYFVDPPIQNSTMEWIKYKEKYRKSYWPVWDDKREENFDKNIQIINQKNKEYYSEISYWAMGLNTYTDWSDREIGNNLFTKMLLYNKTAFDNEPKASDPKKFGQNLRVDVLEKLPSKFDWRDHGWFPDVRDQGHCASSWAFASILAVEKATRNRTSVIPYHELSVQALLDCVAGDLSGCDGHELFSVYKHIKGKEGTSLGWQYPYEGNACTCRRHGLGINDVDEQPIISGLWANFSNYNNYELAKDLINVGPFIVHFPVDTTLAFYKTGIYTRNCTHDFNDKKDLHYHTGVVIGYGTQSFKIRGGFTETYWIIRNSFGTQWGENGYMRMAWEDGTNPNCVGYFKLNFM